MTKQEVIKAFMAGKEIVVTVNAGEKDRDKYGLNRHHITNREVELDRNVYVKMMGPIPADTHRGIYVRGYIEDLHEWYAEVDNKVKMEFALA